MNATYLQHSSNHQTTKCIHFFFVLIREVMGVTTLDSDDILGTGDGIELRSWGVQRWRGCVVLGLMNGVSDVPMMSMLMFRWWRWKCSSVEWGNVRVVLECMFEDVVGYHRDMLEGMFESPSWPSSIYLYWRYIRVTGFKEWLKHEW